MENIQVIQIRKELRTCGSCTACCEGWLPGNAYGYPFWPGRKCHFVGEGCCSIYEDRPEDPCKTFECAWIIDDFLPEWLKPSVSKVICVWRTLDEHGYLEVTEAGQKIDSEVLSYLISLCITNNLNIKWQVCNGFYYLGTPEFRQAMSKKFDVPR